MKLFKRNEKNKQIILTCDDISKMDNLNEELIKEYCRLGEKRLQDCLETKKQFEKKASILLSIYMPLSLALFGLSAQFNLSWIFNASAFFLFIGTFFSMLAINFSFYGNLGRHPQNLLIKDGFDYLTIKKENQVYIYAYNLEYLIKIINISNESNRKKRCKISIAIWVGFASLIPFIIKLLLPL